MPRGRVAYKQYSLYCIGLQAVLATAYYTVPYKALLSTQLAPGQRRGRPLQSSGHVRIAASAARQCRPSGSQNTRASSPGVKERPPPEPRRALLYRGYDIRQGFSPVG